MFSIVFILALFEPGANELNYKRIEYGMTREQVIAIVRQAPISDVTAADRSRFYYTTISAAIREEGELWRTSNYQLWIVFDKNQRVTGKMLERRGK